MAKERTVFICSECSHSESKWLGRCPECGAWNSLVEKRRTGTGGKSDRVAASHSKAGARKLSEITVSSGLRFTSGVSEMDSVLGGGIMSGSSVLIGGEPGIGKSTLLLQVIALSGTKKSLYIAGEESVEQIRLRAERLNLPIGNIHVLSETRLETILDHIHRERYQLIIVDSIQTLHSEENGPVPGTVNQIKYSTVELADSARTSGTALFLVGHVTKDGTLAGPKVVEHLVDTVLYFDHAESGIRILRATKNRFGSVDEIGVFTMTRKGLVPAQSPESFFLGLRRGTVPAGTVAAAVFEGSRTFMVEIQALVVPAKSGYTRVYSDRIDSARVSRVAAILEKHSGILLSDRDIYINVAGGIRLAEVGIELPLALALFSAVTGKPVTEKTAAAGELTLAGEIRVIGHIIKRVTTAQQMGFDRFYGPDIHHREQASHLEASMYASFSDITAAVRKIFTG